MKITEEAERIESLKIKITEIENAPIDSPLIAPPIPGIFVDAPADVEENRAALLAQLRASL